MIALSLLLTLAAPSASAGEGTLDVAELPNSAQTLPKGAAVLRPLGQSSYGVSNSIEVNSNLLGLFYGPNVGAEFGIGGSDSTHLSVRPQAQVAWNFQTYSAGVRLASTFSSPEGNHLSVSLEPSYGRYASTYIDADGNETTLLGYSLLLPLKLDETIAYSDSSAVRIWAMTELTTLPQGLLFGTFGVNWAHAFGPVFHGSFGLGAVVGTGTGSSGITDSLAQIGIDAPGGVIVPYPDIRLWWRI